MNPFLWSGPEFLVFYAILAALIAVALAVLRLRVDRDDVTIQADQLDPYTIAVLRGGPQEAIRVAAASLVEQGALEIQKGVLQTTGREIRPFHGLERALLQVCVTERQVTELRDETLQAACESLRGNLVEQGLLLTEQEERRQVRLRRHALTLLVGTALVKLAIALASGHTNVFFLIVITVVACTVVHRVASGDRTPRGDAALRLLRKRLADVERERPPEAGSFLRTAALFGLAALPLALHPWLAELAPDGLRRHGGVSAGGGGEGSGCGGGGCGGCGGD